jgi:serine/threonine-protein kinase
MTMAFVASQLRDTDPFGLDCNDEAMETLSPMVTGIQVAWPFTRLSLGELSEFIGRWAAWFAQAAIGGLTRPQRMPERDPQETWRR